MAPVALRVHRHPSRTPDEGIQQAPKAVRPVTLLLYILRSALSCMCCFWCLLVYARPCLASLWGFFWVAVQHYCTVVGRLGCGCERRIGIDVADRARALAVHAGLHRSSSIAPDETQTQMVEQHFYFAQCSETKERDST